METILFDKISHIEYSNMKPTDMVNKISAGEIYQPIFDKVEDEVMEADQRKGFWFKFWGEGFFPKYKATEDRWRYSQYIGTVKFIEEHNPCIKFIDDQWYLLSKLVVHYLDKNVSILYFNSDEEMVKYVDINFPSFRGLDNNKKQKIKVV